MVRSRGFTLIELVIVVAVIGILAAVAFPSYINQVRKSNRAAAQAFMLDLANRQTLYLGTARSYGTLGELGFPAESTMPNEVTKFYTIKVDPVVGPPPSFTITAEPKSGTKQVEDGWLAVDSAGTKTSQYPQKW